MLLDTYYMCITMLNYVHMQITPDLTRAGMANLAYKLGQIGPNGTNLGLFKISFSTVWLQIWERQNVLKLILKSPRFVLFEAKLIQLGWQI